MTRARVAPGLSLFALTVLASGCVDPPRVFSCERSEQCERGTCEPTGYCSFPDDGCATGRRYGEYAPAPFANACVASGSYAELVLGDHPSAYWRLDETSGTLAADSAGANHGTYVDGPMLGIQGALADGGSAASFDGVDDLVVVSDAEPLRLDGSFSIEFWAKLIVVSGTYPSIVSKGPADGADGSGYFLYYTDRRVPVFKRDAIDSPIGEVSDRGALATDAFKHYVVTYDAAAQTLRWYVNGAPDNTFTSVRYASNADMSELSLGGRVGDFANEALDEIALYDHALSPESVQAHYSSGIGTPGP